MLQIIACRVGLPAAIERIESGLEAMQKFVGGYVDCMEVIPGASVDLWCNDDGLMTCEPNRLVGIVRFNGDQIKCPHIPIHGNFFLAKHDDQGETISLAGPEAMHWLDLANTWPMAMGEILIPAKKGKRL